MAFNEHGEIGWSYNCVSAGTKAIVDVYALNVKGREDVWLYFYTEFPLVHFHRGRYRTWTLGERGAHAIAVREPRALLFGGHDRPGRVRVVEMSSKGSARVTHELQVVDPEGADFESAIARGVGGSLYFFRDRCAYVLDAW